MPRFYLAALEKNREVRVRVLQGCEIKSGRVRPGFEARYGGGTPRHFK